MILFFIIVFFFLKINLVDLQMILKISTHAILEVSVIFV